MRKAKRTEKIKNQFPDNMEIRLFTENDRYEVASLIRSVLDEHGLHIDTGKLTSDIAKLTKRYEEEGAGFWVLLMDGEVIGTVALKPQGEYTAEIEKLYLSSRVRGRGIGRSLLQFVELQARRRGFRRLFILCPKKFERAVRFFQNAQYRMVGSSSEQADNLFEKELD